MRTTEVAVLIPAREKLSRVHQCLDAVLEHTPGDVRVYLVDVGYSPHAKSRLQARADSAGNVTIVPGGAGPVLSNAALNLAFEATTESVVCVVENDVVVGPGYWGPLAKMLSEGDYDLVSPTIWDGRSDAIHFDPPRSVITAPPGEGHHSELVRRPKVGWPRVPGHRRLAHLEKHCFAGTRAAFEALVPFDEAVTTRTDMDLSLSAFERGLRIGMCPESVVTFFGPPVEDADREFFAYRWDEDRARQANDHVVRKWNLTAGDYLHFVHEMRTFL